MRRLRSYLLLTLVFGVLAGWAAAIDSGRLFDTWAFLTDTETDTGNIITAGTLRPPINLCTSGNVCTSTSSSVHLAWSLGTGITPTGQKVFRATSACPGSGLPAGAAQVGANQTAAAISFDDTTVAASTTYCYYIQSFLQNWTANSNTAQITTTAAFTSRTLRLHNSTAMDTSLLTASSLTVNSKGGTHTWGYTPAANSTLGTTGWSIKLAIDSPTQAQSGNDTNILVEIRTTNCAGAVVTTLVNTSVLVPDVSATAGKTFALTPSGSATLSTGQALCLTVTNNDSGGGGPHDLVIRTDYASTLTTIGIISGLVVPITP